MNSFFAALQFLTVCPWPARMERSAGEVGRSAIFFPVIGFALGSILLLINWLLQPLASSGLLSAILVAVSVLATRGFHLDGLADTFDGLGAGGDRRRILEIMDDSHTGVFGVTAIALVLLIKVEALDSLANERWRTLLLAPLLSRWAMALLAHRSKAAKEGLGSTFMAHFQAKYFFAATFVTFLLAVTVQPMIGVALMAGVGVLTLGCRLYLHRRLGGVTGDTFGAVGELNESFVMVAMALVSR